MTAYAVNNLGAYTPPDCPRCGEPAKFDWEPDKAQSTYRGTYGGYVNYYLSSSRTASTVKFMMVPKNLRCETVGCVDENGHPYVTKFYECGCSNCYKAGEDKRRADEAEAKAAEGEARRAEEERAEKRREMQELLGLEVHAVCAEATTQGMRVRLPRMLRRN